MVGSTGMLRISADTTLTGEIRNCKRLDVFGTVEGDVMANEVVVHEGGHLLGRLRTDTAEVKGRLEGDVVVRNLIAIRSSGVVQGDVRYGRMALESGGELSASVKNVPPELTGDFEVTVRRGQHVLLTTEDIDAIDPDNSPDELTYTVSNARGGHVALIEQPEMAVENFTQADLNQKRVAFVHRGGAERKARFNVVVHDSEGASSGKPRTVDVTVVDTAAAA